MQYATSIAREQDVSLPYEALRFRGTMTDFMDRFAEALRAKCETYLRDKRGELIHRDEDDRFGIPESAFQAALDSQGRDNPVFRLGMYVPRREVATMPPAKSNTPGCWGPTHSEVNS